MGEINLDLESAILNVGKTDVPATPPAPVPPAEPQPAAGNPPQPVLPAAPAPKRVWTFNAQNIYKPHKKMLDAGDAPEKIPHRIRGLNGGCQCAVCKTTRGEFYDSAQPGGPAEPHPSIADPIVSKLITEKFAGRILNIPNDLVELALRMKGAPKEAIDEFKVDAETIQIYGETGKVLADYYLKLPDFKHKELIVFGAWYGADFGARITGALMVMKMGTTKS